MGIEKYLSLQRSILHTIEEAKRHYKKDSVSITYIADCVEERFHTVKRHLEDLKKQRMVWMRKVNGQVEYTTTPPRKETIISAG